MKGGKMKKIQILNDSTKILKDYTRDKSLELSLGNDKNINPHSPDYAWFIATASNGTTYEVQVRPTMIQSDSTIQ